MDDNIIVKHFKTMGYGVATPLSMYDDEINIIAANDQYMWLLTDHKTKSGKGCCTGIKASIYEFKYMNHVYNLWLETNRKINLGSFVYNRHLKDKLHFPIEKAFQKVEYLEIV